MNSALEADQTLGVLSTPDFVCLGAHALAGNAVEPELFVPAQAEDNSCKRQ